MQVEFWKQGLIVIVVLSVGMLLPLGLIIAGIIMAINGSELWILIPIGVLVLFICLLEAIVDKDKFTKVILDNNGITTKCRKSNTDHISWCDVTDVKITWVARGILYLSFVGNNRQIDVALSQMVYNAVMELCSNRYVKSTIEDIPRLDYYKKRRLKQQQKNK